MIKLLVVLVGLIAIGNGELVLPQLNAPLRVTGSQLSDWYVYKVKIAIINHSISHRESIDLIIK